MRLNARLDEEDSMKIKFLAQKTRKTLSAIMKEAIRYFYEHEVGQAIDPLKTFKKTGFIGCAAAEKNLSRDYKKILESEWKKKHGHR